MPGQSQHTNNEEQEGRDDPPQVLAVAVPPAVKEMVHNGNHLRRKERMRREHLIKATCTNVKTLQWPRI